MAACRLKAGLAALQQHQRATDRVCRALAQRCPGSTELQHMYHDGTRGFTPVPDALAVSPELLVQQPALPEAAAAPLLHTQPAGTKPPLTEADRPAEVDAEDWAHLVQLRDLRLTVQREAASVSQQGKGLQQQIDRALLAEQQMLGQIQLQKEVGSTVASKASPQHRGLDTTLWAMHEQLAWQCPMLAVPWLACSIACGAPTCGAPACGQQQVLGAFIPQCLAQQGSVDCSRAATAT